MTGDPPWGDLVTEFARRDTGLIVFGASAHRYQFGERLSQAHLETIEDRYGFIVPDEYRTFLTKTGNGGASPGYGLWPLGYWDPTDRQLEAWDDSGWTDQPSQPFPHTDVWNLPTDLLSNAPAADAPWEEHDVYAEQIDNANWQAGLADGTIPIANLGCAIRLLLVVTGPERGHIWIDDRANDGGLHSAQTGQHPEHMTFADLYQDWLGQADHALDTGQRSPRLW